MGKVTIGCATPGSAGIGAAPSTSLLTELCLGSRGAHTHTQTGDLIIEFGARPGTEWVRRLCFRDPRCRASTVAAGRIVFFPFFSVEDQDTCGGSMDFFFFFVVTESDDGGGVGH